METLSKRGQLGGLDNTVIAIVIVGITLAAGIYAAAQFNSSINDSNVDSVMASIIDTMGQVPTYITIIVILALIAVILYVVKNFGGQR